MEINTILEIQRQNLVHLLDRRNVVACGVGYKITEGESTDEPAIVISVTQKVPAAQLAAKDLVPKVIDGVKTDVIETGVIRAFQGHQGRWRPVIPPGVTIGHINVTAGTFGCLVRRGGEIFILSNNHVLADVNAGRTGDPILQPGRYDGGTPADQVATLGDYIPIDFGGEAPTCGLAQGLETAFNQAAQFFGSSHRLSAYRQTTGINHVDVALAYPASPDIVTPDILEIGPPKGVHAATLGTPVKKSGRTTGLTHGQVIQIAVTTQVSYNGRMARFTDQLMAGAMSAPGDSGSAVLNEEGYVVGLLFAGSDTTTIINPIQFVLDALGIEIVT
jgi:hypothetical protein